MFCQKPWIYQYKYWNYCTHVPHRWAFVCGRLSLLCCHWKPNVCRMFFFCSSLDIQVLSLFAWSSSIIHFLLSLVNSNNSIRTLNNNKLERILYITEIFSLKVLMKYNVKNLNIVQNRTLNYNPFKSWTKNIGLVKSKLK